MECKFATKYGDKRLYLAKMYPCLTSSMQSMPMTILDFKSSQLNPVLGFASD